MNNKVKSTLAILVFLIVSILSAIAFKHVTYWFFYESLVEETVKEIIKEEVLYHCRTENDWKLFRNFEHQGLGHIAKN